MIAMANKSIPQTIHTITALDNFADWLTRSMKESGTTNKELANYVGVNLRTIITWKTKSRYPRLDQMVMVCEYFGLNWVAIPFNKHIEIPTNK